ncbi:MAG TPA: ABC transporter permease [Anaerolinea thermolimosa]|uniref:ABC transporter permease n=1 Tax=Anaerolinea thermolimosa TaxID=229919 RepID=A0A3D1JE65_9CHLR|nr:ABC transporter permease [Anaerolinea thermolimosa]GAP08180.1 ABC-type transport system related with lipoprotein release, permease component [Anaerolinea thermolimosa]HCE16537.1 ABC transporter permease [Anaerolinea thermolimosa]
MRLFDLLALIFYNLSRRKGRVALTAIGVVIGTAAVVLLVALATGLQRNATRNFAGITDLTMVQVYPKYGGEGNIMMAKPGGGAEQPSQTKLLTTQAIQELAGLEGVQMVIPRDSLRWPGRVKVGKLEAYPYVFAVDTEDLSVMGYELLDGTLKLERGTALIGESVAKSFNDPNWRPGQPQPEQPQLLGQQVRFILTRWTQEGTTVEKTIPLRIVGILKQKMGETDYAMVVRMDDLTAWNEWGNGKRINRNKEGYEMVMVKAKDSRDVTKLADTINNLGYQASTPMEFVQGINNFYTIIQIVFGGIGAIALLVAAIGIANTMTMAILERTREIGLMKAIGATNRNVMTIFLGEAAGIGLIGGLGGVLLAWGLAQVVNVLAAGYLASQAAMMGGQEAGQAAYIAPWLPLFALAFSTLVGLVSGLYPALRAATMVPVLALKYE